MKFKVLIGSYTDTVHKNGLNLFEFDNSSLTLELLNSFEIDNASFFCRGGQSDVFYAVNEDHTSNDQITALHLDSITNKFKVLNQKRSGGSDPCYLSVDSEQGHLFCANYSSGTLSVSALNADGSISAVAQVLEHAIPLNDNYHLNSHMHAVVLSPDEKYLLAANLGLDTISVYSYDPGRRDQPLSLRPHDVYTFPDGTGPRHLLFSDDGKFIYVVGELDGTVHLLSWQSGRLTIIQTCKLMPEDYRGINSAAEIKMSPTGHFLYVSNRGDANMIITFQISKDTGSLTLTGRTPTEGIGPRNFSLDPNGDFILITHQKSDDITCFRINPDLGVPQEHIGTFKIHSPVFIRFL